MFRSSICLVSWCLLLCVYCWCDRHCDLLSPKKRFLVLFIDFNGARAEYELTIVLALVSVILHCPLWNIRSLFLAHSSVDKSAEKRSSELQMLRLLNNLLVRIRCVIGHDHVTALGVDFRVQARVFDQVHDPALGFFFVHVELLC